MYFRVMNLLYVADVLHGDTTTPSGQGRQFKKMLKFSVFIS